MVSPPIGSNPNSVPSVVCACPNAGSDCAVTITPIITKPTIMAVCTVESFATFAKSFSVTPMNANINIRNITAENNIREYTRNNEISFTAGLNEIMISPVESAMTIFTPRFSEKNSNFVNTAYVAAIINAPGIITS